MTAPDVNLEKQKSRHRPALLGMGVAVVLILGIVILAASLNVEDDAAMDVAPAPAITD